MGVKLLIAEYTYPRGIFLPGKPAPEVREFRRMKFKTTKAAKVNLIIINRVHKPEVLGSWMDPEDDRMRDN